jgi:hypothetical protein
LQARTSVSHGAGMAPACSTSQVSVGAVRRQDGSLRAPQQLRHRACRCSHVLQLLTQPASAARTTALTCRAARGLRRRRRVCRPPRAAQAW